MFERIDTAAATLVLDLCEPGAPKLAYLGPRLREGTPLGQLSVLHAEGPRPASADKTPCVSLVPVAGFGFLGAPALVLGGARLCNLMFKGLARHADGVSVDLCDEAHGVHVRQTWVCGEDCFRVVSELRNQSDRPLELLWLAAATLPLPVWARTHWTFVGRWAGEFRATASQIIDGVHERVGRGGRSGFDYAGYGLIGDGREGDFEGTLLGLHLAWSGNARLLIERTGFGLAQVQLGESLEPGAIVLGAGQSYRSPEAYISFTQAGFHGIRRSFHAEAQRLRPSEAKSRRVHFNTWEAAYFDFDLERLKQLADSAAALGAERFVLDDGWFKGRRGDDAGLGDWTPDAERFPDGLAPLIAHAASRGMDFGLWVEPEMVSPQSELLRAHPDWVLHHPTHERPLQRRQLALDLTRPEVKAYIFEQIDALLGANRIAYLKWDHNRDLFPSTSHDGSGAHGQTLGFYEVLERVSKAHPDVEIESCASGAGRMDFGVLGVVSRFWASDNTDAAERLRIQSDISLFMPLRRIGSHVGASPNPSTGRRLPMLMRARVAMFAHMGVEADPTKLNARDAEILAQHIALYKEHRTLIHDGAFFCYAGDDPEVRIWMCVARDKSQAIGIAVRLDQARGLISAPVRLVGLERSADYAVELAPPWPAPAHGALAHADIWRAAGQVCRGELLEMAGLRLPLVHPQTCWLWRLTRVGKSSA